MRLNLFLTRVFVIAICGLLLPGLLNAQKKKSKRKVSKEICITFNELPVAKGFGEVDKDAVTYLILDALKQHKVKATGFVVGNEIEGTWDILGQWLNEGHTLGSMTYSNQDYQYIGIEPFIEEIQRGIDAIEPMISNFGQKKRYFRFPYLHHGETYERRSLVEEFLEDSKQIIAHTTIVPEDYLYNLSFEKIGKSPDSAAFIGLLNEYINHVIDELERVEQLGMEIENRQIRQILLLRANRLNAVYLDDLLTVLSDLGYKFITLDRALGDKLYERDETYFGPKGLGYLDRIIRSDADFKPAE